MKTTRISIVVAVMLLVITTSLSAVGASELTTKTGDDLRELVSKTASQIPFLNINYVLYDESIHAHVRELFTDEEYDVYETFRSLAKSTSDEKWLPLLYHNDAKVRTLAMSALYLRGDPKWLPKFVTMRDDTGKTFPEHQVNPLPKFFFVKIAPAERRKWNGFTNKRSADLPRPSCATICTAGDTFTASRAATATRASTTTGKNEKTATIAWGGLPLHWSEPRKTAPQPRPTD